MRTELMLLIVGLGLSGCAVPTAPNDETLLVVNPVKPSVQASLTTASNASSVLVKVRVSWRAAGTLSHSLSAPPKGKYRVVAFEPYQGFAPLEIRSVSEGSPTEKFEFNPGPYGAAGILVLGIVTAPIWGPVYLASKVRDVPAGDYLWIEDADTGEVVAGKSPWDQNVRQPTMSARGRLQPVEDDAKRVD